MTRTSSSPSSSNADPEQAPRGTSLVAGGHVLATLLQLLFLKIIATRLAPEAFGAVIVAAAGMAGMSFSIAMARALAATRSAADLGAALPGRMRPRLDRICLRIGPVAVALAGLFALLPVHDWLHLPSRWFSAFLPLLAGTALILGLASGTLLGSGRDRMFALLLALDPALRCVVAALLLLLGVGGNGLAALLALLIGPLVALLLARSGLPAATADAGRERRRSLLVALLGSAPSFAALTALGLLSFLDVLFVRHVLDGWAAAEFAAIAVGSRFLLLLPLPVSLMLSIGIAQRPDRARLPLRAVLQPVGMVIIILLLGLLVINEFGGPLLSLILDGDQYGHLENEYVRYALAASLLSLSQVLVFLGIALGRVSLALLPLVVIVAEVLQLREQGGSLAQCVSIVQGMAGLLLVFVAAVVLLPLLWSRRRRPVA